LDRGFLSRIREEHEAEVCSQLQDNRAWGGRWMVDWNPIRTSWKRPTSELEGWWRI
jgi:hypothetical protein